MSGEVVFRSMAYKAMSAMMPAAMQAPVAGLVQPQIEDCRKPKTLSPIPVTDKTSPR
jgi:hypothetical protein